MAFRRNQKENKYLTEIDPDEIEIGMEKQEKANDPYIEDIKNDTRDTEKTSDGMSDFDGFDVFDIPATVSSAKEPASKPEINTSRESSTEKEIEMVKDLRTNQTGAIQMKVARPRNLREATAVADSLLAGQTIVLNLDALSDSDARRMIDYIAGVIFAIRGKIERPADRTFLLTPSGVNVATEEKSDDSDE